MQIDTITTSSLEMRDVLRLNDIVKREDPVPADIRKITLELKLFNSFFGINNTITSCEIQLLCCHA